MTGPDTLISITMKSNGLSSPIKRHRLKEWIEKQDLSICCLHEIHLTIKLDTILGLKDGKDTPSKWSASVTVQISDKIEITPKSARRDKDTLY